MGTAPKIAGPQLAHVGTELSAASIKFLFEKALTAVPLGSLPPEFYENSSYLPFVVLVPKSAVQVGAAPQALLRTDPRLSPAAVPIRNLPIRMATEFSTPNYGAIYEFGEITVNFSALEARRKGELIALTPKEFQTLAYLIHHTGRVIPRDELLNEVWGYECYPSTRTVDNHILKLRQKLEADPSRPKHILTAHSAGYKFVK
jgi:Transcriptional regulatory protein, C terminal